MEVISSDTQSIEHSIREIFTFIGDNPEREGLIETPARMIKSWDKLFGGYKQNPEDIMKTFTEGACDEMVILKDIEFYSTCEHHFLPFFGKINIAYIPNGRVIGISKLARLIEIYARRLQIQERLVEQIANSIEKALMPLGVFVMCEAQHFCMTSRGVEKQNSKMITSSLRGIFKTLESRNEALELFR